MMSTAKVLHVQPLGGHYWWVAGIVGPHVGAVIGGWLYFLSIDHASLRLVPVHDDDPSEKTELRSVVAIGEKEGGDGTTKEVA